MQKTVDEVLVRIWGVLKMRELLDGGSSNEKEKEEIRSLRDEERRRNEEEI